MTTKSGSAGSQDYEDQKDWFVPVQQTHNDFSSPFYEFQRPGENVQHNEAKASWRSLFAFTTRQHSTTVAGALVATILAGIIRPTAAILFGKLWNALTVYGAGNVNAKEMLHQVSIWCIALTVLGAGTWIVEGIFFSLWMLFGELQARSVRQIMFSGMRDKSMEWYDLREDGMASLLNRIETQVRELQLAVSQPLGMLLLETVTSLASIGTALFFSWKLTLVILATFPVAAGLLYFISKGVGPAIERQKRELSKASKYASNAVTAIDSVKAFNGQDQEVWQYFLTAKAITKYYLIQARSNAFQFGIIKFFAVGLYVSTFWFGLYLVIHGSSTVGHVLTTFVSCAFAMQAAEIVLPQFLVLAKGISAGETLKSIMAEMQDGRSTKNENGDLIPDVCPGDIEINDISFAYPSNPRQDVLNNATFFFPAGETTFVVGKSGSGKSTVGNLLMKYYEPHSGEIVIDGQSIQTLNTEWLRQNVMLVQQQSSLFNETILQNIAFGTREYTTRYDIRQAARSACLEQTIDEMPKGFDTVVGSKNRALSGGQSQRVAIARARLRNAPVLILDESTSALDHMIRGQVMNKIRDWRHGKTTIIITHDVSQIFDDDYVYVLQNAKVVQEGYRKGLSEKAHGAFAHFLRGAEADDVCLSSDLRRKSVPASPTYTDTIEPSHESTSRWKHLSHLFYTYDSPSNADGRSMGIRGSRLSMGAAVAQANELRAKSIWSSPVIPESPTKSSPRNPPTQLMAFMSPRPSPQVPAPAFFSPIHKEHLLGTPTPDIHRNLFQTPSCPKLPMVDLPTNQHHIHSTAQATTEKHHDTEPQSHFDQKPASLSTVFRSVWPALTWNERIFLVLGLFASIVVGAATPTFAWLFSQLLKTFYSPENRTALARKWAMFMLASAVVDGCASYMSHYFLEHSGQAWINSLRVESLRRILAQPKSWFDKPRNAPTRLTECLDRDAEEMRNILGRFIGLIITIITMLSVSVVWAFIIDWKLTLVSLASAPVMYAITKVFHWSSGKWEGKYNQACEATSSIFSETFSNIRVVRALTLESYFEGKHLKAIIEAFKIGKTRAAVSGCMFGLTDSLSYFIVSLLFYYGAVTIESGDATVTTVLTVINILIITSVNAIGMFAMIPQLNSSRTTATQVLHLANLPLNESHESQGTKRLTTPFPIKFNKLSFTYPSRPHVKTLDKISLEIPPGSCTAIVGPSGSGKSTIASLLLGLYPPDPEPGLYSPCTLTVAGKSILDCNIYNVRSHMALVPQTPLLFPTTIFANITYGLPETSPYNNLFAVERTAIDAGIHDFIMSLENGYNTLIGEGGMGLSGGQAQRVAIARALVRRPKVLVLDEATSALDIESAEGIRETVKRLRHKGGMAVVIISHSVDMMRIADTIVMIDNGKVVDRGGFEELRTRGGAFASLIGEVRSPSPAMRIDTGLDWSVEERFMTPVRPRSKLEWSLKTSL